MGVLQIDTIHVVARSPYLVLYSRLGAYPPRWLDELLAEGHLFEYWAHAACFIPIESYPFFRRIMLDGLRGWLNPDSWLAAHPDLAERIIARIRAEGPLRSADFESAKSPGGWWNWKEEKLALEHLLTRGDLMVRARQNFQRVYDLRERVLPAWDDAAAPTSRETRRALLVETARCLGITRASWAADYFRLVKTSIATELADLARSGELNAHTVEGWSDPVYSHPAFAELLERIRAGELAPSCTVLLSPFDPVVWDRRRTRELFNFDYTIECYLPASKRRYGYFSLPILHRGALVGRLDAKANRQEGIFEVRNLSFETGVEIAESLASALAEALRACAAWHDTPQVAFRCPALPSLQALFEQ